jgi:sugar phosphate isomerase/epimerase
MIDSFESARKIGAKVMRVVGSSLRFRDQPHAPQLDRLRAMFREAVKVAQDYGIKLAVENHIDFTSSEMLQLLDSVDSAYLGINFDTGNFVRLLDDPIEGIDKLADRVYATHIKDLKIQRGVSAGEWYFFSSVPIGEGVVDNDKLVRKLANAGFDGLLAVEIDFLHPDYKDDEDGAVTRSVGELRRLVSTQGS